MNEQESTLQTFIPRDIPIIPLVEIWTDIKNTYGKKMAADFSKLMLYGTVPESKTELIACLQMRNDYISQSVLHRLENS